MARADILLQINYLIKEILSLQSLEAAEGLYHTDSV